MISLGSAFGCNYAEDQVRALHRAVHLWDNLSKVSGDTSDLLCCLVTGTAIEGRKYYSNADLDRNPIRRAVGLTAIGMPAGLRPDALDRLIAVELPPLAHRIADAQLQERFDRAHPALLSATYDAVAAALAGRALAPELTQYRMAAYAGVLAALDSVTAVGGLPGCPRGLLDAYDSSLREFRQRTAAEDAFGGPLLEFMRTQRNRKMVRDNGWETKVLAVALRAILNCDSGLNEGPLSCQRRSCAPHSTGQARPVRRHLACVSGCASRLTSGQGCRRLRTACCWILG